MYCAFELCIIQHPIAVQNRSKKGIKLIYQIFRLDSVTVPAGEQTGPVTFVAISLKHHFTSCPMRLHYHFSNYDSSARTLGIYKSQVPLKFEYTCSSFNTTHNNHCKSVTECNSPCPLDAALSCLCHSSVMSLSLPVCRVSSV